MVGPKRLLIVEGGGDKQPALQAECRRAFSELQRSAGLEGRLARVFPAGGRKRAYDKFCEEHSTADPRDIIVLLVDTEDVVTAPTKWAHVKARVGDGWDCPPGATEDHLHFMAVVMETWLIADPAALLAIFGARFDAKKIPGWPALEKVSKSAVYDALQGATSSAYDKGKYSFKVLAKVKASTLESRCPSAVALFAHLRK